MGSVQSVDVRSGGEPVWQSLRGHLAAPRPNGSAALRGAVEGVWTWLEEEGIPVEAHTFMLSPYFMELLGAWLATCGLLLPLAALAAWGWVALAIALLAIAVPLLEVWLLKPTITALIQQPAQNLVVTVPALQPEKEILLCAHLDSKTELLDHVQRRVLLRLGAPAMGLALASGVLAVVPGLLPAGPAATALRWLAFVAALPVAAYGLGMAANLIGGRFSRRPSSGAVDDGAAVAVLLELARRLHQGTASPHHSQVTLLFTVGEEAQMQGALAYVRDRVAWPLPTHVINLEVLGQDGGYVLWNRDGTALTSVPNDASLNSALEQAVMAVTGGPPHREQAISCDAFAFLRHGIPAATLGSHDRELGGTGYHSAQDCPERVHARRITEAVQILESLLSGAAEW